MNLEKHRKNPIQEWLEAEESTVPTHSRGSYILGSYIKLPKPTPKKFRPTPRSKSAAKPPADLAREPAPPPKLQRKRSPAASLEHLRKLERLPQLRAPFHFKSAPPPSPPAAPRRAKPVRAAAKRKPAARYSSRARSQ